MTIHTGDCITVMRTMEPDSVDAIVTDPPAGVSFMSKTWDHNKGGRTEWVAWMTEVMRECYRVLKPGGYAVVWSLPRTCHWTGWAMEDAGFYITDQLAHIFASGFPKGRTQLKPAREDWWLARKPGPLRPLGIDECRIGTTDDLNGGAYAKVGGRGESPSLHAGSGMNVPGKTVGKEFVQPQGRWPSNVLLSDPELFDEPNPYVVGSGATAPSKGMYLNPDEEPDIGARGGGAGEGFLGGLGQRRDNTYANETGGYSRFFAIPRMTTQCEKCGGEFDLRYPRDAQDWHYGYDCEERQAGDDSDGLPEPYPRHFIVPKSSRADREPVVRGQVPEAIVTTQGKAEGWTWDENGGHSTGDNRKPRANQHPTVKPVDLMRHLIRLVTPPGGTVLDPFGGSGTTALACELEGFPWILIEKEPEYVAIAEARLNGTQRGLGLDVGAPTRKPPKTHPDLAKHQPKHGHSGPGSWFVPHDGEEPAA